MGLQIKNRIVLFAVTLWFVCLSVPEANSQPGYPDDGFYIYLNTDFIDFPDTLHSDWEKAEYLNKNLKIVFIDSTKSIENDSSLIKQCYETVEIKRKKMYSIDSTKLIDNDNFLTEKYYKTIHIDSVNIAYTKIQIDPLYDESLYGRACYEDKYIVKDLSLSSQSKGTIYWYTGKLIFIYEGVTKEFFLKNIPDGCTIDLKDIKLDKLNESVEFPPFLGKDEIRDIDLNEYRK